MKKRSLTLLICFLFSAFASALTFSDMQSYVQQNGAGVDFAQFNSILRNGYYQWDPSPRAAQGATFAIYYGTKTKVYTDKRNVGKLTTFALPYQLKATKYYITVKEVLNGKEGPAAAEIVREKR